MIEEESGGRAAEEPPLLDLPLRTGAADLFEPPTDPEPSTGEESSTRGAAPLSRRWRAMAADAAIVVLLVAAALLSASALRGGSLSARGLAWAAVFALYLSFFATVVPLVLFGRTLGMALSDLSARAAGTPRVHSGEGTRRWLGTLATLATVGLPLLFTRTDPESPSLADRISGRPLVESERGDRS